MQRTGTVDMTKGSIRRVIVNFAVPVFISQLFQQLYNIADSVIVGNLLGKQALAAVSSSSALLQLFTSLMVGISLGAGVVVSRFYGAGDDKAVSDAVHTTYTLGIIGGLILTIAGVVLSPVILRLMGTVEEVLPSSIAYFRCYFLGAIAVMLYNVSTGIMNALGDSRRPLYYLLFSSVVNVLLDLLFIGVFRFGVGSAAVATAISQAASAFLCWLHLRKPGTIFRLQLKKLRLHGYLIRDLVRNGLPTGIQNSVISLANVLVQANINSFGADAIAGCGSYGKLQGFVFLPITSFSLALSTFVSQNLGAKEYTRARKGAAFGVLTSVGIAELIGIVLFFTAPTLIALFNSDPAVVEYGVIQNRIENLFFFLLAYSHAISGVFRGAGRSIVPMTVMLSVWCLFRVLYITVTMSFCHDIRLLFCAYPITWLISSIIFLIYYKRSDWVHGFERNTTEPKEAL